MSTLKLACHCAVSGGVPVRSLCVALVVGTILNLINQGDALFGAAPVNWIKIFLTYLVPYAVCTYGAVSYQLHRAEPARNSATEGLAN
jgi:ABC-type uncharacterized transport system permease subunit